MKFEITTRHYVKMNYGLSLPTMIHLGHYDWVNPDINYQNFPVNPSRPGGELEIYLVHFKESVESGDVIQEIDKTDLRLAELPELLAIGAQHQDEQRKYPIVCLGSVWKNQNGIWRVPCLVSPCGDRRLRTRWYEGKCSGYSRFVAVRK